MLATIIIIFSILFFFCAATWIVGIIENAGEDTVMSLRTFRRLLKGNEVFDIDMTTGVGYYNDNGYRDWAMPLWTWYPLFMAILIGDAFHKDVI